MSDSDSDKDDTKTEAGGTNFPITLKLEGLDVEDLYAIMMPQMERVLGLKVGAGKSEPKAGE